jgi:hypothetical protein
MKYYNRQQPQFTVDITGGTNDLPPFELKSK